jgi:hypothetical protein
VGDDNSTSVWVDGMLRMRVPSSPKEPSEDGFDLAVAGNVAAGDNSNPDALDGLLDNVRAWRRPRSASELYAAALGCK